MAAQRAQLEEEVARQAGLLEQLESARQAQAAAEAGVARLEAGLARLEAKTAGSRREADDLRAMLVNVTPSSPKP